MTCEFGWSRAAAGALVFSKRFEGLAFGMSYCLSSLGALPETIVWDREGAIHDGRGNAGEEFAAFCGRLALGWLRVSVFLCRRGWWLVGVAVSEVDLEGGAGGCPVVRRSSSSFGR